MRRLMEGDEVIINDRCTIKQIVGMKVTVKEISWDGEIIVTQHKQIARMLGIPAEKVTIPSNWLKFELPTMEKMADMWGLELANEC